MAGLVAVTKGISGSGKSSRVLQLLKYFEAIGLTLSEYKFTAIDGKTRPVGVLVEGINLLFVGKFYKSGDIERWQGYDTVTSCFKGAEYFSEFLKERSSSMSFIIEGAGIVQTNRLRPTFLSEIGFKDIFMQYYNYGDEGRDDYHARIVYRSGEPPKKNTMWEKNIGMIRDCVKSRDEASLLKKVNFEIHDNLFDTPIEDYGVKFLKFTGNGKLVKDFKKFVKEYDYINTNKFENFQ